ncbi:PH domain-containing protein [Miniimonas arenae]|uniref:PH domain-containing protein n=1 Tax=Miniimonas arenae TaxID=676201 RepID=UPI001FE377EC|nr:PH domain-containing protein [Miniimonas arenae]
MTVVLAPVIVASLIALFVFVRPNAATVLTLSDYLLMVVFAGALLVILWRQGTVTAVPDRDGITVRNLVRTTRVAWNEVVSVRFSSDRAWAQLDLADGEQLAVMAVQSADGAQARREAQRLAALAERFGGAREH